MQNCSRLCGVRGLSGIRRSMSLAFASYAGNGSCVLRLAVNMWNCKHTLFSWGKRIFRNAERMLKCCHSASLFWTVIRSSSNLLHKAYIEFRVRIVNKIKWRFPSIRISKRAMIHRRQAISFHFTRALVEIIL